MTPSIPLLFTYHKQKGPFFSCSLILEVDPSPLTISLTKCHKDLLSKTKTGFLSSSCLCWTRQDPCALFSWNLGSKFQMKRAHGSRLPSLPNSVAPNLSPFPVRGVNLSWCWALLPPTPPPGQ